MTEQNVVISYDSYAREFLADLVIAGSVPECEKYVSLIGEMFSENWSIVTTNLTLILTGGQIVHTIHKRDTVKW